MVAPLLFSFSDQDASPTVSARVGTHVIADGSPQVSYQNTFKQHQIISQHFSGAKASISKKVFKSEN